MPVSFIFITEIMPEYLLFIAGIVAFLISLLLVPVLIKHSYKNYWVDDPNPRKIHRIPTPVTGGTAIFASFILPAIVWFTLFTRTEFLVIFLGATILFVVGVADDLKGIRARKKLYIQLVVAFLVVASGIRITSFQGFLGIYDLPVLLQYCFTILVVVGVVNAYNLMDGVDGLVGGISFLSFGILGLMFYSFHQIPYAFISFALAGGILGFLIYNFSPAKIFMGDSGALTIGFMIVVFGIKALEFNIDQAHASYLPENMVVFVSGLMLLPVSDTIRVLIVRIFRRRSPFLPDKDHVHHLLLKLGLKPVEVTIVLYSVHILIIFVVLMINFHRPVHVFLNTLLF
jgi:UDP-GlcNAc:undecaprenyl-phosphate/decaprenyl-phosphate GlcNAc-1-phosphate transferase